MKRLAAVLTFILAACEAQPRSASYFEAHPEVARQVVEACRSGHHRGDECENAKAGDAAITIKKRIEMFSRGAR